MNLQYDILFRVRIKHEYYTSGFSKDFEFVPTPSCQQVLDQFGFLFRNIEDGFLLLARVESTNPSVLFKKMGTQNLRFAFEIKLKNPYFYNISGRVDGQNNTVALNGYELGKEVFYFNNVVNTSTTGSATLGDSKENLQIGTPINLTTGFTHNFSFDQALQNAAITMEDIFQNAKTPIPQLALPNGTTTEDFQIDLKKVNALNPGRYVVEWPTGESEFMFEPGLQLDRTFGIIELFKNDDPQIIPATHRFLNGDTIETKEFSIDFKAHPPVRWYYIFNEKTNSIPLIMNSIAITDFSPKPNANPPLIIANRVLQSDTPKIVREAITGLTMAANDNTQPIPVIYSFQLPEPSMQSNIKRVNGQSPYYELYYYV